MLLLSTQLEEISLIIYVTLTRQKLLVCRWKVSENLVGKTVAACGNIAAAALMSTSSPILNGSCGYSASHEKRVNSSALELSSRRLKAGSH